MPFSRKVKRNEKLFEQLVECLRNGSDVQRGICAEVMEYATKDNPQLAVPFLDSIIAYINYDAPKVKWETARVVANASRASSESIAKAIPKLFLNAEDIGTVGRWSAAYALAKIAIHSPKLRANLIPRFMKIVKREGTAE